MVVSDLREFVPDDYFSREIESLKYHETLANAAHYSSEMRWGYLAAKLGQKLFFHSTVIMTARQTSAAELLMSLGMLASSEAAQGASQQISSDAKSKGIPDGNSGLVSEQLLTEHIPILSANIRGALKQYLHHLTPSESAPYLALLEKATTEAKEVQLFPDDAIEYCERLCAKDFADAWIGLDNRIKDFTKSEIERGRPAGGSGFTARISKLYVDELGNRAQIILKNLKKAHQDFGSLVANGIDEQLNSLGASLIEKQPQVLHDACERHLSRIGITHTLSIIWDLPFSLQRATIANGISDYLWILRKVPMKSLDQPAGQPTFIIQGNVGAIQTAPNAVAHVQIQNDRNFTALHDALMQLSRVASSIDELDENHKKKLMADITATDTEIKRGAKDEAALLEWLMGIGSIVQTLGSVQPAWSAVRAAARSVGLPL